MDTIIYHNPRCSKSRQTLAFLTDNGIMPVIVKYLESPLNEVQLKTVLGYLGKEPQEIIRFKEGVARELGLTPRDARSSNEWLALLAEHPVLMERPIVVRGQKAAIGRPPENVLAILD